MRFIETEKFFLKVEHVDGNVRPESWEVTWLGLQQQLSVLRLDAVPSPLSRGTWICRVSMSEFPFRVLKLFFTWSQKPIKPLREKHSSRFSTFPLLNYDNNSRTDGSPAMDRQTCCIPHPALLPATSPTTSFYFLTQACLPPSTDGQMTCCFLFLPGDLHSPLLSAQLINLTLFLFFLFDPFAKCF